jgi:hypothetical protein
LHLKKSQGGVILDGVISHQLSKALSASFFPNDSWNKKNGSSLAFLVLGMVGCDSAMTVEPSHDSAVCSPTIRKKIGYELEQT